MKKEKPVLNCVAKRNEMTQNETRKRRSKSNEKPQKMVNYAKNYWSKLTSFTYEQEVNCN